MARTLPIHPSLRHPRTGLPLAAVGVLPSGRPIWPILGGDGTDPLARLTELAAVGYDRLTAEQLAEFRGLISAQRDAIRSSEAGTVELSHIKTVSEYATALKAEAERRGNPAASALADLDAALADPAAASVPVAASARPAITPLSAVAQTPHQHSDLPTQTHAGSVVRAALTASGANVSDGMGSGQLADLMNEKFSTVRAIRNGDGGRHSILRSRYTLPHTVGGQDPEANAGALTAAVQALTASGGVCRPVGVDYSVPTWTNTERPVRNALPGVLAPRGGLAFAVSPIYDATVYGAGVSIWTEANDQDPGGSNTGPGGTGTGPEIKPCLEVDCGEVQEVMVEAITSCLTVSNFRGRFSPESVAAVMGLLEQAWAATADAELLRQMRAVAKHVSYTQQFGIARDALVAIDRVCAYTRDRYRLNDNVVLRVVLKRWVRDAIRADLAKAAFPLGTADPSINSLAITNAQIDAWLAVRGVVPIWTLDDDTGDQSFGAQGAGTSGSPVALVGYPAVTRMLVYPEGTFQVLDGGELNLGVVRDSALNSVNKYQVFSESFEAVAFRGFEAVDFKASFVVNGASAGTASPA